MSAEESSSDLHVIHDLPVLVVHAHSSCNCRCIMCDIWKTSEGKAFRKADLEPHLASIRRLGVRWVVFSGGEPLMNAELPVLCEILRAENIRLTLLTSGLLLQKCASTVAAGFEWGIPTSGTMAHSYVLAFPTDVEAFCAFMRDHPGRSTLRAGARLRGSQSSSATTRSRVSCPARPCVACRRSNRLPALAG